MPKQEEHEILVEAPAFGSQDFELLKDTTGAETLDVFKLSERAGRVLSFVMIPAGALLFFLSVFGIVISIEFSLSDPLFIGTVGFLGAMNIIGGLILLARR